MNSIKSVIVINAIQATGGVGDLVIRCDTCRVSREMNLPLQPATYVRIRIRDRGNGIPEENLRKIFDPYFTTKEMGTGLGLAICYSVIKKHNGHIQVESKPGWGTEFSVFLPAVKGKAKSARETELGIIPGTGRILIMDDEEIVLRTFARSLKSLGYRIELVRDGEEAITEYRNARKSKDPFSAVIMDLVIPGGLGGGKAVKKILKLDRNAKVIATSGYADNSILANYRKYGFKDCVRKPFDIRELSVVLKNVLSG